MHGEKEERRDDMRKKAMFTAAVAVAMLLHCHGKIWNVRDCGAAGNGIAKDTQAIQKALDAAGAAGGGVVQVPAGTYLSGTVYMRSGVELKLEEGATIKGSPDREDYCSADAFPQNAASKFDNTSGGHLLVAVGCTDVALRGPGSIDGNSAAFLVDPETKMQYPGGKLNVPWRPAQMIFLVDCRNVTIDSLGVCNSPYWSCFILNSDNVKVSKCRIATERSKYRTWNGDGLDIDRCTNVVVEDCHIDTYDDSITLRASSARRLKSPQDCADVVVRNCRLSSNCNAVRVGVGEGVVRDCSLSGLEIYNTRVAFSIVSSYSKGSRGVDIRNIRFADCNLDCRNVMDIGYRHAAPEAEIRDITFSNISGRASHGDIIREKEGYELKNIVFENCSVVRNASAQKNMKGRPANCAVHRGDGIEGAPENSLEAAHRAWSRGFIPECDVRKSKDGKIIAFHDRSINGKPVDSYDWNWLKDYDIGSRKGKQWSYVRIPTWDALFAAMKDRPERRILTDYKNVPPEVIAEIAKKHGVQSQVYFCVGNISLVHAWKKANPEGKVLVWIWTGMWGDAERWDIKKPEVAAKCEATLEARLAEFDKPGYPRPDIVQIHVRVDHARQGDPFAPSSALLRKAFAKLKSLGIEAQAMPWTGGDKIETYQKLWALGPDSFSTDYPDVLDEFLRSLENKNR